MSRYDWLNTFNQHLKTGTKGDLEKDIEYCTIRSTLLKQHKKMNEWDKRKQQAEKIIVERFGN